MKPDLDISDLKHQNSHTAITNLGINKKMETTLQPTSTHPHRLLNHSLRVTNTNSPSNGLSLDIPGFNNHKAKGHILPLLQIKTPVNDQGDNQSMQNSLYGRGFRTPVKRNVSYWDAKWIQDSNNYQKEQQMKHLQVKNNVI